MEQYAKKDVVRDHMMPSEKVFTYKQNLVVTMKFTSQLLQFD
jgi:hypothetical protein